MLLKHSLRNQGICIDSKFWPRQSVTDIEELYLGGKGIDHALQRLVKLFMYQCVKCLETM